MSVEFNMNDLFAFFFKCSIRMIIVLIIFRWVFPILWKGRKDDLEIRDFYQITPENCSTRLGEKLSLAWNDELERKASPNLISVILRVFYLDFSLRTSFGILKDGIIR